MQAHVTEDFTRFDAAAHDFLESDPVRHTVPLSIAAQLRAGIGYGDEPPWFAWLEHGGSTVGVALRTPPHLVVLTPMPVPAATVLGAQVAGRELPGATGDADTVAAFAAGAGRRAQVRMTELQYVLERLTEPPHPGGAATAYRPEDEPIVLEWLRDFNAEVGLTVQRDERAALHGRIASGAGMWLWWADGRPVSMAGGGSPDAAVPRIGPVWTPPEHRRRGYAAAVTAHACRELLHAGARALTLFTDATNPTSNAVYQRLGFERVGAVVEVVFDPTTAG
jgi:predicted GNAT family acetyltransferase